jgi:hypothetical protein
MIEKVDHILMDQGKAAKEITESTKEQFSARSSMA